MPLPKYIVRLTAEERTELEDLIRTGKRAASVLIHARILLKADVGEGGPGWDDERIAEAVECGASTVYRVRRAFVEEGLAAALFWRVRPQNNVINNSIQSRADRFFARTAPSVQRCS